MSFHLVTVFHVPDESSAHAMQEVAMGRFGCQGIEEYTLNEPQVDALLGDRSYSGGDLPFEVINEVDQAMMDGDIHQKFFFSEADLNQASEFVSFIKTNFLCEVQLETLDDQDWNAEWKKHYKPIPIGETMVVLPEWIEPSEHKGKLAVRIHPGMGFGTGSHETTYLCLKNFLECDLKNGRFTALDYGSGSGILGIAALLVFPQWEADFVDIDPEAHRNCVQNLELNSIELNRAKMLLVPERDQLAREYPVVFANILQNILHEERDYLIAKTEKSGYLLLSGLLKHQTTETKAYYAEDNSLELVKEDILNDWACLVWRKK